MIYKHLILYGVITLMILLVATVSLLTKVSIDIVRENKFKQDGWIILVAAGAILAESSLLPYLLNFAK